MVPEPSFGTSLQFGGYMVPNRRWWLWDPPGGPEVAFYPLSDLILPFVTHHRVPCGVFASASRSASSGARSLLLFHPCRFQPTREEPETASRSFGAPPVKTRPIRSSKGETHRFQNFKYLEWLYSHLRQPKAKVLFSLSRVQHLAIDQTPYGASVVKRVRPFG